MHYGVFQKRSQRSPGFFIYNINSANTSGDSEGAFDDNVALLEAEYGVWLSREHEHDD